MHTKGKMKRKYDESVNAYQSVGGKAGSMLGELHMDTLVLGRRLAMERELESSPETLSLCNVVFDESGNFLIYGSLAGIKVFIE
jgi:peptidylprolyl isomerase domain and WD repeat-containing protein 1